MTMVFFMTALIVLLLLLAKANLWALSKITEDYAYVVWKKIIIALHTSAMIIFFIGYTFLHGVAFTGIFIRFATIIVIAEFMFSLFVLFGYCVKKLKSIGKSTPFNQSRRSLLKGTLAYPACAAVATVYGATKGIDDTVEREYQIPVKNLPENLKGFRIAQLSDIHLGMFFSVERLKDLIKQVAAGKPDALLLTGDVFDDNEINAEAIKVIDSFANFFPNGIYYCFGNHEHFRGIDAIADALKNTKINLLNNSSRLVIDGKRPLYFLGVDYPSSHESNKFAQDMKDFMAKAMKNTPKDAVKVLLAHHPEFIDPARENHIELTLTGHTHGSQFGFLGMPLFPIFKYNRGFYNQDDSYGYVHSGNGSWFPYRMGCPPEIAYFTLRKG